jgi:hypothetical protein
MSDIEKSHCRECGQEIERKKFCGARLRGQGERTCRAIPMENGRCRLHGGASLKGVASGTFVSGRYSKYLGRHRRAYEELIKDEEKLLDLREHIAAMDVVAQRAAERAAALDTPDFRGNVKELVAEMEEAFDNHDADALKRAFLDLKSLSQRGGSEDAALTTLGNALDRVAKRVESAWKLKISAQGMASQADMDLTHHAMLGILKEEISDKKALGRVVARFYSELLSKGARVSDAPRVPRSDGGGSGIQQIEEPEARPLED